MTQEENYQEEAANMTLTQLKEKITQLVKERRRIIEHVLVPDERTEALRALNTDIAEYTSLRIDLESVEKPIPVEVRYAYIDSFNRPIFLEVGGKRRFGCVDKRFPYQETESEVLKQVKAADLVFLFGGTFDCEPSGQAYSVSIVKAT
jgi:hypothetical protein